VFFLPIQLPLGPDRRLAISDFFILAYLLATAFRIRRLGEAWSSWYAAMLAVMGMGLFVALLRTGTVGPVVITQKALGLVFLMVTVACLVDFMSNLSRICWVIDVFIAGVALNVAVALVGLMIQQDDPTRLEGINYLGVRLSGFVIDPNAFGGLIACALMLHLFAGRATPFRLRSPVRQMLTGLLGIGLVLTFSRSAWIAAVLGILVAVSTAGRSARRVVLPVILTLGVAVPILASRFVPDLPQLANRQDQVDSRVSIIGSSLSEYSQSPIFGIGLDGYIQRHGVIIHNTLLWFLCEMGIIGLVVLLGFLLSFAARLIRIAQESTELVRATALSILAAHAAMLGLSFGIEALYQRQWWLLFAAGAALGALRRGNRYE
jgi:O-antigen ligase